MVGNSVRNRYFDRYSGSDNQGKGKIAEEDSGLP